jgi:hypothetical protein
MAYRDDVMSVGSWGKSMTHSMAWKITTAISSGLCMATPSPRWHTTSMVNSSKQEAGMIQATQEMVKPLSSLTGMYHVYWVEKCILCQQSLDLLACCTYAKNRTDRLFSKLGIACVLNMGTFTGLTLEKFCNMEGPAVAESPVEGTDVWKWKE